MKENPPHSFGFGVIQVGRIVDRHPRIAGLILALVVGLAIYGVFHVSIDRDLRDMFRGESATYQTYVAMTDAFTDPENQVLVLIEGPDIVQPAVLERLRDLQFELQLLGDAGSVYSLFSLRTPPDADGRTTPVVPAAADGLSPELIEAIRSHPLLGQTLVSADGTAIMFVVTHAEAKASLAEHNVLIAEIDDIVETVLGDTDLEVTLTGFAALRAEIVRLLKRDQLVLNGSGGLIGFVLSLILFRSFVGSIMTAAPAAMGALLIIGWNGLLGVPVTILSNVVPALIMVIGYADGMHLTSAFRRFRSEGKTVAKAERAALFEVGPACMLAALTTIVAFVSMYFSDVRILRDFATVGAIGTFAGTWMVLIGHMIVARLIGRYWKVGEGVPASPLDGLAGPVSRLTAWAVRRARPITIAAIPITIGLGALFLAVPPENSVRETLPSGSPSSIALNVVDTKLGGAFPVQVVVPMDGIDPLSAEGLGRIRAVHEAIGGVPDVSRPLSLWSLAQWIGDGPEPIEVRLAELMDQLPDETYRRVVGAPGALVSVNVHEMATADTNRVIDAIEAAALAVDPDVIVTGSTVVNAREATRTINNLTRSFAFAIVVALILMSVALRSAGVGLAALIPNLLPITATGAILYLFGSGMQITSVLSLTIAFGIAVDDTIHYLNVVLLQRRGTLNDRLVRAARNVGAVLIGTTIVIVAGLMMTLTSGLATVSQFGILTMATLVIAMAGDLIVLPAMLAWPFRRFFQGGADRASAGSGGRKTRKSPA